MSTAPARPGAERSGVLASRDARRGVYAGSAAGFGFLAAGLCVAGLMVPGLVRPGGWQVVVVGLAAVLVVFGSLPIFFGRLPAGVVLAELLICDAMVLLAVASLVDRASGAVFAALLVLPTLYGAAFLPYWVLPPQIAGVVLVSGGVMLLGGPPDAAMLLRLAAVVIAALSSMGAVVALRRRLVAALRQARALSTTDPLTGLSNRRGMAEAAPRLVRRALQAGDPIGVIVADVDHFKRINDEHGHAVGDEVLQGVAESICSCLSGRDIAVRFGGEEIAVLTAMPPADLVDLGEDIRRVVRAGSGCWSVSVSVGVAWAEPDDSDPLRQIWAVVDRADDLMYHAKRAGRDRVVTAADPVSAAAPPPPALPGLTPTVTLT